MDMFFLPDTPITALDDDALDFAPFARQLHAALIGTQPPFVFGVLGDWGTGKTSILRLLEAQLNETGVCIPIWFDAWRYENETNILYPCCTPSASATKRSPPSVKAASRLPSSTP